MRYAADGACRGIGGIWRFVEAISLADVWSFARMEKHFRQIPPC